MDDDLLDEDLDAYLADASGLPLDDEEIPPPANVDQADLLMRRYGSVVRQISRIEQTRDRRIGEITAWCNDRTAGLYRRLKQIEAALEAWTRAVMPGRKTKTEHLSAGAVSLRSHSESVRVLDDEAFVKWCAANNRSDAFVKTETTHKPMIAEIKRLTAKGPQLEDVDIDGSTFECWAAVDPASGEVIPDVQYRKEKLDTFTLKP